MLHRIPPRMGLAAWGALGVCAVAFACPRTGRAQVGPEKSAALLKPADGLEATLWASEPMVHNPTNMDIDSRGRVWVAEGLNYRLSRNNGKPRVDDSDKIKILEDTDGDGKADKMTVFADKIFPVPMGLAVEERYGKDGKYLGCRVYVGNSPDLLVFEDTDGDDKADKRSALLTGFGGIDSDHGVHGMVLGLDGKLYFTHGDGCCSVQVDHSTKTQNFDVTDKGGRHVSSDQLANTLRVNRDGTQFEILADRQRNNYETSLNAFGNIFTSDNDDDGNRGCRVIWIMDGGHYGYRTPGSPRHWGEEVPGNVPKLVGTGNGSPCGLTVYEGDLLPKSYHGAIFEAEAGTRQINSFPLTRQGASFRTDYQVLLASDDPWFRPVDVTTAPDGSVFVADWYDAGVGGHAFRDQDTGRIYRVAPKGSKAKAPKADFSTVEGLIKALKSPVVATQDAARHGLIERGEEAKAAVLELFTNGTPIERARALWVWHAIDGDPVAMFALTDVAGPKDPRIREQAVRILGRDVSHNGKVEFIKPEADKPPAALKNLDVLLALVADPDTGVRRELILAFRNLPTDKVGEALKTLARTWDGQDRWYLEALGLALEGREPAFFAEVFDGTLYGDLDLENAGKSRQVSLPPYFPVDRNEAYIAVGDTPLPASALSKTLGLAWRVHRPEVLPLLGRIMPQLSTPELQQAADDVIRRTEGPEAVVITAELALRTGDPVRKRQVLATLTRKLEGAGRDSRSHAKVTEAIEGALKEPTTRIEGIQLAAASREARYADVLAGFAADTKAPNDVREAAIEALGSLQPSESRTLMDRLIGEVKGKPNSNPAAEAAVRTLSRREEAGRILTELFSDPEYPLGLRRQALRTFAQRGDGARGVIKVARAGKLPSDLKTEATTLVSTHPDRNIRDEAEGILPLPKSSTGRPLPPFFELVRREGKADHGREVFFRAGATSCGGCHRVQGQGQWVGPDLSTIGTKYGRDELLRSILNPSAAIGYNYRTHTVALGDGRVLTGLAVEDGPDGLVLKTAERERIRVRPADIEDRKVSEVSLMPEGLAETMSDDDLVDLLAFLASLRQPVSIVGQYHVVGPLAETGDTRAFDLGAKVDLASPLRSPDGKEIAWRRVDANAEGLVDVTPLTGDDPSRAVYLYIPVISPVAQEARLVLDTKAHVEAWLNGRPVTLPEPGADSTRSVVVNLPLGPNELLIRLPGGPDAPLVTTLVAGQPLEFRAVDAKVSAR